MIVIQWLRGPGRGEIRRFDRDEVSIGSSNRNDLALVGRGLLRRHCVIRAAGDGRFDLVSISGRDAAVVNGERCFKGPLAQGDRLQLGSVQLVFMGEGDAERDAAPTDAAETADSPVKRGRRPVEVEEVAPTGPRLVLERELAGVVRDAAPFLAVVERAFERIAEVFPKLELVFAGLRPDGSPEILAHANRARKSFVFSRKILAELALRPRPLAAREGRRLTTYYPLETRPGELAALVVVRGVLDAEERELFETVAGLLQVRLVHVDLGRLAPPTKDAEASGPRIFDPDTGRLGEETDDLHLILEAVEKRVIDRVLRRRGGNQSRAAHDLGISRGGLIAKMKTHGLPDYRKLRQLEGAGNG